MLTKREWLVQQGLAKAGSRGRFSAQATAALYRAIAEGMTFADPEPVQKPATPAITQSYNVKSLRRWAASNGIALGSRGRIPTEIVEKYLAATGEGMKPGEQTVITGYSSDGNSTLSVDNAATPKAMKVEPKRTETVAWGYAKRGENDPKHISEPLVAISNCGGCGSAIAYCGCKNGPTMPSYLGGGQAMLRKPA